MQRPPFNVCAFLTCVSCSLCSSLCHSLLTLEVSLLLSPRFFFELLAQKVSSVEVHSKRVLPLARAWCNSVTTEFISATHDTLTLSNSAAFTPVLSWIIISEIIGP